jgi:hypothetical protein
MWRAENRTRSMACVVKGLNLRKENIYIMSDFFEIGRCSPQILKLSGTWF